MLLDELIASRRRWIEDVLVPWCRSASRKELLLAELDWTNLAGEVAPETTLYRWAWSRFPDLIPEQTGFLDETHPVRAELHSEEEVLGFPDGRASERGELALRSLDPAVPLRSISIDELRSVRRIEPD